MSSELTIVNGRILGHAGATALHVVDGRIARVGTDADLGHAGEVIDARGGLVIPGLDDAHIHLRYGARQLGDADLFGIQTAGETLAAVARHAAGHPERAWVRGRGWVYSAFEGGLPHRRLLDAVVPDRPAWLRCYDGHTGWANTAALRLAGITRDTVGPATGVVVKDADGEPTGVLKEDAQELIDGVIPVPTDAEDRASVADAITRFHRDGMTAAQDAMGDLANFAFFARLADEGALPLRLRTALDLSHGISFSEWTDRLDAYEVASFPRRGGAFFAGGILKAFADGVIEARTASMLAPYEADSSRGLPNWDPDDLKRHVAEADRRGWQIETHAIGDAGVRMVLDAYEQAARTNGAWPGDPHRRGVIAGTHPRRHRVEHIETIDPADVARFARLGVVASMQPFHADPSPNQIDLWASNIGPERASRAWAWGTLRNAGARLAFGSDWPVVPWSPWIALHNAVNRQTAAGTPEGGWLPGERVSLEVAIEAYTAGSAYAAFEEHRHGRIAQGYDADLAVLDRDLLTEGASAIIGTTSLATLIGGRIVHRSEGAA
jgi:predicted amidohydrolase YtcJ